MAWYVLCLHVVCVFVFVRARVLRKFAIIFVVDVLYEFVCFTLIILGWENIRRIDSRRMNKKKKQKFSITERKRKKQNKKNKINNIKNHNHS